MSSRNPRPPAADRSGAQSPRRWAVLVVSLLAIATFTVIVWNARDAENANDGASMSASMSDGASASANANDGAGTSANDGAGTSANDGAGPSANDDETEGPSDIATTLPTPDRVLADLRRANAYFMERWPDPGEIIVTNRARPSNIWTRAVYYEGLMALFAIDPQSDYHDYAVAWGEAHDWGLRDGNALTRDADNQAAGQTYIDLYRLDSRPERILAITASVNAMLATDKIDDWDWIDALQMAMPVFAKLGVLYNDDAYLERMYAMYRVTRDELGDNGLFNPADGLWWRDASYDPPYASPNGENVYWSRGNGWVLMALARVLDILPDEAPHRDVYAEDFRTMARALVPLQRADGFWNVSLHDPAHFGGPETSGTAMFVYGLAHGVNAGLLDEATYLPVVTRGWRALADAALRPDGSLGYVQSTGADPEAGQPVTYESRPDFEDFALGAFLLAGTEVMQLAR